jgi:hypothetical protein
MRYVAVALSLLQLASMVYSWVIYRELAMDV